MCCGQSGGQSRHLLLKLWLAEAKAYRVEAGSQKPEELGYRSPEREAWLTQGCKAPPPEPRAIHLLLTQAWIS